MEEIEINKLLKDKVKLLHVPGYVEYISDWKEFQYPTGHLILDKTICGCGFTEYCLNNSIPTILCSPRKKLLENKEEQHNKDKKREDMREIYYFRNDGEAGIDFDNSKDPIAQEVKDEITAISPFTGKETQIQLQENLSSIGESERELYLKQIKDDLRDYLGTTDPSCNPFKIIVTYDSLHHVLDVVNSMYTPNSYVIVVDEFQSIFIDSSFKASVELDFVEELKCCDNVLYLSATPMLEKYLIQLDYFRDLPFYKLEWPKEKIEKVRIERRITRNINKEISSFISDYRSGKYPIKVLSDGTVKESKELVIFVNSIRSICDIIRKNALKPEEVNIICADTTFNIKKLKALKHSIGSVPLEGKPHKMFTLCTRTTYLGADFYSTSAYSIVCCDCNITTLTLDISLDLPQIIGRQRLKENVFRNEVLILYKAETKKNAIINESKLANEVMVRQKEERTIELLEGYEKMSETQKLGWGDIASDRKNLYRKDYIGVSSKTGKAVFNYLVKIADQRAYDVSRRDYQDDITIRRGIEGIRNLEIDYIDTNDLDKVYEDLYANFETQTTFVDKMKLLCDTYFNYPNFFDIYINSPLMYLIPREYFNYINILGFERIRSLSYQEGDIIKCIESQNSLSKCDLSEIFNIGDKYSKKDIKNMIGKYYLEHNINKTPKASDLGEYFELKPCQFLDKISNKKVNGFMIIAKK